MTTIVSFSLIIWILIDRLKRLWEPSKFSSIITSIVALASGILIAFLYNQDLIVALEIAEDPTILGKIFTGIAIMGGSSCINEILKKFDLVDITDVIQETEEGDE